MTGEVVGNAVMGCGWVWRDFPRGGSARSLVAGVEGMGLTTGRVCDILTASNC